MDQNMNSEKLKFPHPGEILRVEFLEEMGITQYKLAVDIGIPHSRVTAIIKGRRAISPDHHLRAPAGVAPAATVASMISMAPALMTSRISRSE